LLVKNSFIRPSTQPTLLLADRDVMATDAVRTNRLEEIGIYEPAIAEMRYPFKPAR
jgi:hypothetical protein